MDATFGARATPAALEGRPDVRVRPIRPADAPALERFYAELSDESLALRFFAARRGLSHAESSRFCATDHSDREGFVAEELGDPNRIVGHLCMEPADDDEVELAVAVADDRQRHGIGRRLVGAGIAWARRRGMRAVTMTVLNHNAAMLGLVRAAGVPTRCAPVGLDVTRITADLGEVPSGRLAA